MARKALARHGRAVGHIVAGIAGRLQLPGPVDPFLELAPLSIVAALKKLASPLAIGT
jgi:hypothetical protein